MATNLAYQYIKLGMINGICVQNDYASDKYNYLRDT